MNKQQYREALEKLNLTQGDAADLMGLSLRTAAGYAIGGYPIPKLVELYLNELIRRHDQNADETQEAIRKIIRAARMSAQTRRHK